MNFSAFGDLCRIAALDSAAKKGSRAAEPDDQEDIYQDAWVKFLRWPPVFYGTAVRYSKSARNSLWRYRKTHPSEPLRE